MFLSQIHRKWSVQTIDVLNLHVMLSKTERCSANIFIHVNVKSKNSHIILNHEILFLIWYMHFVVDFMASNLYRLLTSVLENNSEAQHFQKQHSLFNNLFNKTRFNKTVYQSIFCHIILLTQPFNCEANTFLKWPLSKVQFIPVNQFLSSVHLNVPLKI